MKIRIVEQRGVFRIQRKKFIGWESIGDRYFTGFSVGLDIFEFDTYKKAENHIKKFYGLKGVDAIEKPEWRTV